MPDGRVFCTPGSSPRARGTQDRGQGQDREGRFIPAGAGNTSSPGLGTVISTVHPRGRGEHNQLPTKLGQISGSSPRARGTRSIWISDAEINTVHPRGRGEHGIGHSPLAVISGSSPRARGTHRRNVPKDNRSRFIPAGAGNTVQT